MQSGGGNFSLDWMDSIRNSWNSVIANPLSAGSATYLNNLKFRSDLTAKGNNHASDYIYNDPKSPYYNPNFQQDNVHINNANQYEAWQKAKLDPNYDPREWEHMNSAEGYDPNLLPIDQANYDKQYPGFDRNEVIMENMAGAYSLLKGQEAYDAKPKDNFIQESGFKGFKRYSSGGNTTNPSSAAPKTPYDNYLTKYWGNNYNDAVAILTGNGVSSGENRAFNPKAINKNKNGSMDLGLFQINSNTFKDYKNRRGKELAQYGIYTYEQMKDPEKNTILAKLIFDEQGHNAWYGSPYHKNNISKKQMSPLDYYNLEETEQDNTQVDSTLLEEQPTIQPMTVDEGFNLNAKFSKFQNGSLINMTGYTPGTKSFDNPINIIPDNNITMKNTPFDILAIPNNDNPQIMKANTTGRKFKKSTSVLEIPLFQSAGVVGEPTPLSTTFTLPNKSTTLVKPTNIAPIVQEVIPRGSVFATDNLDTDMYQQQLELTSHVNKTTDTSVNSFRLKGDNTYEYAKQGDKYLTRKIGTSNWIDMSTALSANDYSKAVNTIQSEGQVKPKTKFVGRSTTKTPATSQATDINSNFRGNSEMSKISSNTPNTPKPQAQKTTPLDTTTKTDIFGRPIKPANMSLYSLDKQYTDEEGQLALNGAVTAASLIPVTRTGRGAINIGEAVTKGSEKKIKTITDALNNLLKGNKTRATTQSGKAIKFKKTNPRAVFNTK